MQGSRKAKLSLYSLTFQILLGCVIFTFSHSYEFCSQFADHSHCKCDTRFRNIYIHCASVEVVIKRNQAMEIQCNNHDIESFFKEFPGNITAGEQLFELNILNCSFDYNNSIIDVLNHINVSEIIVFSSLSNQGFHHKAQFGGLQSLLILKFAVESSEALPSDLFENMPNVEVLELYTNQTRLAKGIFDPCINLEDVRLTGKHNSMVFPDGIFDRLKNLKIVHIKKVKKLNISKDIFASTSKITFLDLSENDLSTLPSGIFDNLNNLYSLTLKNNPLNDLPNGLFHKTRLLRDVTLTTDDRGNLRTLPSEFLANLSHLNQVELSASFEELPEDLFYGSRDITFIGLSGNKLRKLPVNLFRDQKNLERLNLKDNLLETLPDDIFRNTTNLRELILSDNLLTQITGSIFQNLTSLQVLWLHDNALDCIEDGAFYYTDLEQLSLSHNQLIEISDATFSGLHFLRVLDLGNNNLSFIATDAFCDTTALETLNLNHNNLNTSSMRTFLNCVFSLHRLESFDLGFNKIATITNEDFEFVAFSHLNLILTGNQIEAVDLSFNNLKFLKEATIKFDENPIKCDCKIADFVEYLKNQSSVEVETENLFCEQPMEFQGDKLVKLNRCDLRCQNDDAVLCPESCRCEKTLCSDTFIIDCSNSGLVRFPTLPTLASFKFDKILLDLQNNSLKNLQQFGSKSYDLIVNLNLSGNILKNVEASQLPANVETLDLSGNKLRTLPDDLFDSWSRNSSKLKKIYLAHNPWPCGCESRSLLEFMITSKSKVVDRINLQCFNSTNQHQLLINFKVSRLCRDNKQLIIVSTSVIAFCGLVSTVLIALYFIYKDEIKIWLYSHDMCLCFVSIEELERDKEYDGFVSYSHKDKEFVQKELMPFLEHGPHPFKICDHERDWLVGDTIPEQIIKSVENSRRTLIILSDNYLESVWGRMEFQAAHQLAMKERQAKVIIILYGEIKNTERIDDELQAYLNMNTYLEWGNPWFFKKLLYAMPHSKHYETTGELSNPNENAFNMNKN